MMGLSREELEAGRIDFSEVLDRRGKRGGPIHPGEILRDEFLAPLGMSVYALAGALGVPRTRINDIVLGRRAVTAETALRLARFFGTSAEFWVGLQAQYDIEVTRQACGKRIAREVKPRAA